MTRVCILDYGSGNVKSVFNLLNSINANVAVSNDVAAIRAATHLVLPGVGAFGASMRKVVERVPLDVLRHEVVDSGKPFLGICVGMQILADKGIEFGEHSGLGWIGGVVDRLDAQPHPLPHIGWNSIRIVRDSPLLRSFEPDPDFYFLHSYVVKPTHGTDVLAEAEYGQTFCAIVGRANIFGVQFHPEKSQKAGRLLFENFLRLT